MKPPEGYKPPTWKEVEVVLAQLRQEREPTFERIRRMKKAVRGDWSEVLGRIPESYRAMVATDMFDFPQIRDMLRRVTGILTRHEISLQVLPPGPEPRAVERAAKEEQRLNGTLQTMQDQQDDNVLDRGTASLVYWGESWLAVWVDPERMAGKDRDEDEEGEAYSKRYEDEAMERGVPFRLDRYDPLTVFPRWSEKTGGLACLIVQSAHTVTDIDLGLGYRPRKSAEGKHLGWEKRTLSQPFVPSDVDGTTRYFATATDSQPQDGGSGANGGNVVKKTVYVDAWVCQTYLDDVLVDEWEHNEGRVSVYPAIGGASPDNEPGYESAGIGDAALRVGYQIVLYAAVLASNAMQHGFPTPFLENPMGILGPDGKPIRNRTITLGKLNLLGQGEKLSFPFLDAKMMPDFFKYIDWLTQQLELTTVSNFGQALGGEMAGYALAQIRSMMLSILADIRSALVRQRRQIGYDIRAKVRKRMPGGVWLRGAIEETDDGQQYRPILKFGEEHCTDYAIQCEIEEGIQEDWMAQAKVGMELKNMGVWSARRVMEATGVEDPAAEQREISMDRMLNSPAFDQQVLTLAMAMASERFDMTQQSQNTPFAQALAQSKKKMLGQFNGGQMTTPGGAPQNALASGQPQDQAPAPAQALPGGPMAGPQGAPTLREMGVPGLPGGVSELNKVAAPV